MISMGCDFKDFEGLVENGLEEMVEAERKVGEEAVRYAVEHGTYQNHTFKLRKSNTFIADRTGLTVGNKADYASYVESRGFEVVTGAALYAERRLKEIFEK